MDRNGDSLARLLIQLRHSLNEGAQTLDVRSREFHCNVGVPAVCLLRVPNSGWFTPRIAKVPEPRLCRSPRVIMAYGEERQSKLKPDSRASPANGTQDRDSFVQRRVRIWPPCEEDLAEAIERSI